MIEINSSRGARTKIYIYINEGHLMNKRFFYLKKERK
jgi:hypothetical protein